MDIRQIEITLAVAKYLSFSVAAWETSFSPSTVSRQISLLEDELGVPLFERNARSKVSLTPEGEALLPYLQSIVHMAQQLQHRAKSLQLSDNMHLVIGCPDGLSTLGEDELLADFTSIYPDILIEQFLTSEIGSLFGRLHSGEINAVFRMIIGGTSNRFSEDPDIGMLEWGHTHLNMALPAYHPAIHNGTVDLAALKDETFIFRAFAHDMETDPMVQRFVAACQEEGFSPKLRFLQMRHSAAFDIVATGHGVIPLMHIPKTVYPGVVVLPCSKDHYSFSKVLYYNKKLQSASLKKFLSFLRQRVDDEEKARTLLADRDRL